MPRTGFDDFAQQMMDFSCRMFVILGWESELCHRHKDKQRHGRSERADDEPRAELFRTLLSNEVRSAIYVAVRGESSVAGATQAH